MGLCKRGHELLVNSRCRECAKINWREWMPSNKERLKEVAKIWRIKNAERTSKVQREWRLANVEYVKNCKSKQARSPHGRFLQGIYKARIRHIEWTITEREYNILVEQNCFYCGGLLPFKGHGLDRVDNALGYTKANVVPCCKRCNIMKNNMRQDEFFCRIENIFIKHGGVDGLFKDPEFIQR